MFFLLKINITTSHKQQETTILEMLLFPLEFLTKSLSKPFMRSSMLVIQTRLWEHLKLMRDIQTIITGTTLL